MIPLFKVAMQPEAVSAVERVLLSGYIGQGPLVDEFETELKRVCMLPRRPVTTGSCTEAITLALLLLGVGPGDEIITTPVTCTATNSPIVLAGAMPVWADVDPLTGNIDPSDVRSKIGPATKAIVAVDWGGRPCDYAALRLTSPVGYQVPIIQDAAHNPFAPPLGDFVCYSYGPIKHLTCGDGGSLLITGDEEYDRKARLLRWYGLDRTSRKSFRCEQDIQRVGGKFHMNDINAAIGLANLPALPHLVSLHRANAMHLDSLIQNPLVQKLPMEPMSAWWVYTIKVPSAEARIGFEQHMKRWGVEVSQVHARNDRHTGFLYKNIPLPGVDEFDSRQVSIPCGWWMTPEDVQHVGKAVNAWNLR